MHALEFRTLSSSLTTEIITAAIVKKIGHINKINKNILIMLLLFYRLAKMNS